MTMKRKRGEDGAADSDAGSQSGSDGGSPEPDSGEGPVAKRHQKYQKHLKAQKLKAKYKPKAEVSTTDVKKRLRDAQRLLARPNLPATTQRDLERRVDALKKELEKAEETVRDREDSKKNYEKYKYVRFVERQKATRKLAQASKKLEKEPDNKDLQRAKLEAELDLAYTMSYPLIFKYISLYPSEPIAEGSQSAILRDTIKEVMRELLGEEIKHEEVGRRVRRILEAEGGDLARKRTKKPADAAKKEAKKKDGKDTGAQKKRKEQDERTEGSLDEDSGEAIQPASAKPSKPSKSSSAAPSKSSGAPSSKPKAKPKAVEPEKPAVEANPFADDDFFAADDDEDADGGAPKQFIPEDDGEEDIVFAKRRGGRKKAEQAQAAGKGKGGQGGRGQGDRKRDWGSNDRNGGFKKARRN